MLNKEECIIAKFSQGLGIFDQHYESPQIDKQEIYDGPTGKVVDIQGIQAHAGQDFFVPEGKEFSLNIDQCPYLQIAIKAEPGTNTCLFLLVHERKHDWNQRFVVIGKTPQGDCRHHLMSNYFTIEDDNKWHEYVYDLRKIREEKDDNIYHQRLYPDAGSIREIQFYSWTGSGTHVFHFNNIIAQAKQKEVMSLFALVNIYEDEKVKIPYVVVNDKQLFKIQANSGFKTIYELNENFIKGDILRIRAQVEMTNDYINPVRGAIQIAINGEKITNYYSQNNISNGAHHMPLWIDTIFKVKNTGHIKVEALYAAGRCDASLEVLIENGYGHLVVEHYRKFNSIEEIENSSAYLLKEVKEDHSENTDIFGDAPFKKTTIYNIDFEDVQNGDLIRLFGQATSGWKGKHQMHGQAIHFVDKNNNYYRISPWSTENTPWDIHYVPLVTDSIHELDFTGKTTLTMSY